MNRGPLEGYTIGVTADRRADEQMRLLASRGAECLHGPVISTTPIGSVEDLRAATRPVIEEAPDIVVLTTGLGVRSWLDTADALQLGDALRARLDDADLIARGPKATAALTAAGFEVEWTAPRARYDDITALFAERDMRGVRVAVQLDGAGAADLCADIEAMGASVLRVPVYCWSLPDDLRSAERLVRAVVDRRIDAVTFTAKPAVEYFFEIAGLMGLHDETLDALHRDVCVFCVGPVCATGITDVGLPAPFVPVRHRLGPMVQQVAQYFATQGEDIELAGTPVRVQGRLALIDGRQAAWLTDRERAVLWALIHRRGAVLSKPELLRRVWRGAETDEHLVEVTIARLRQRLGPAAAGIETVIRRGYRVTPV